MRILVTRPEPDNSEMKSFLEENGHEAYAAPMLEFKKTNVVWPNLEDYSAIIVTSKNAVRILCEKTDKRSMSLFTVGDQSADLAKKMGFKDVYSGKGNVKGLIRFLHKKKFYKPLLYLRGRNITTNLSVALVHHDVDELIIYDMIEIPSLPEDVRIAFWKNKIDMVIFYSKRTAESFYWTVESMDQNIRIKMGLKRTIALCLGRGVLEYVSKKHEGTVEQIKNPSSEHLLNKLKKIEKSNKL